MDLDAANVYTCLEPGIFPLWDAVTGFWLEETLFITACIGLYRLPKHGSQGQDKIVAQMKDGVMDLDV